MNEDDGEDTVNGDCGCGVYTIAWDYGGTNDERDFSLVTRLGIETT